jgi:coenzyme PQQ biosynthesis protein PqqD
MPPPNEAAQTMPHGRPVLAPHVRLQTDQETGGPVLLFPEGILVLNETAKEIVTRCDGHRTVAEIAALLAQDYDATSDELLGDIEQCIRDLERRQLIVLKP